MLTQCPDDDEFFPYRSIIAAIHLDASAKATLTEAFGHLPNPYPVPSRNTLDHAANLIRSVLRDDQIDLITQFEQGFEGAPEALLFKGLPELHDNVPTPQPGQAPTVDRTRYVVEHAACGVSRLSGTPYLLASEHPFMPASLTPALTDPAAASVAANFGYLTDLGFHSEHPGLGSARPDILGLMGVREDRSCEVPTLLVNARRCLRDLPLECTEALQREAFSVPAPQSIKGAQLKRRRFALLKGPLSNPVIRYKWNMQADPADEAAVEALARFRAHLRFYTEAVVLKPGQMLLFNSRVLLHGRPAYTPCGDPFFTRWVMRVFVTQRPGTTFDDEGLGLIFPPGMDDRGDDGTDSVKKAA